MFQKKRLAVATAAILGLAGTAVAPSANAASATSADQTGQVLIFPYYNVNNDFQTAFNVRNTTQYYKAIKVRFRESSVSNDVLDFNVYMSPFDEWTMTVSSSGAEGTLLQTVDTTCTFPPIPAGGVLFREVYDVTDAADVREGYLEVIEMGNVYEGAEVVVDGNVLFIASDGLLHEDKADGTRAPKNCGVLNAAWANPDASTHQEDLFTEGGSRANFGQEVNGRIGAQVINFEQGYYGKSPWFSIVPGSTFDGSVGALLRPNGGLAGTSILIQTTTGAGFVADPTVINEYSSVAQHYLAGDTFYYMLPSFASGSVTTSEVQSDDGFNTFVTEWPTAIRDWGLDDINTEPNELVPHGINPFPLSHALAAVGLNNEYAISPEFDQATDWVITQPMRKHAIWNNYWYQRGVICDTLNGDIIAGNGPSACWVYIPEAGDVTGGVTYYDREERVQTQDVDFSPPLQTPDLPLNREVSILTITNQDTSAPSVLGSDNGRTVILDSGFDAGWGTIAFNPAAYDLAGPRYDELFCGYDAGDACITTPLGTLGTPDSYVNTWNPDFLAGDYAEYYGIPLNGFMAGRGNLGANSGLNVGETIPHVFDRKRGIVPHIIVLP